MKFAYKLQTNLQRKREMDHKSGIEKALEKFENSPTKLAKACGGTVLRQHVEHWMKAGKVPADKAPDVEAATGIPVEELCPDTNWAVVRNTSAPHSDGSSTVVPEDNRRHSESHPVVIIPDRRTHCEPRPKQSKKRKGA